MAISDITFDPDPVPDLGRDTLLAPTPNSGHITLGKTFGCHSSSFSARQRVSLLPIGRLLDVARIGARTMVTPVDGPPSFGLAAPRRG